MIGLLERSNACRGLTITVDEVGLAVDRIMIALGVGDSDSPPLVLELSRREDAIDSRVVEPGWLDTLPADARDAVRLALAGYHRLAAADEATAAYADLPDSDAASPTHSDPNALVPVTPMLWATWRDAWERLRGTQ